MIVSDQVVPLLLERCPEFRTAWEEHLAWWGGEPAGSYNDVTAFVRFLVERFARGETSCVAQLSPSSSAS